ncbi:hypothetical protein AB0P23_14310 [Rhodococcus sp. NPDC077669]|uniref:hypothetical protein n=1 Tax=Rhodococcus sp. NPDC077669 TaxID=3155174 RepID=UPI003422DCA2
MSGESERIVVRLLSPTGPVVVQLPITPADTLRADEVDAVLRMKGGRPVRTVDDLLGDNHLLALPLESELVFPAFQFDHSEHRLYPVVAYANERLYCGDDPWGVLDWWYTAEHIFDDQRPVDLVRSGELTEQLVDRSIAADSSGMC